MPRYGWKSLILPGICTLIALAVLISLGNWQMRRLAWKEAILTKIDSRIGAEPVSIDEVLGTLKKTGDVDYVPVSATGEFLNGRESHLYMTGDDGVGWHVYTPLRLTDGRVVLVNRGFVPDRLKKPDTRAEGQLVGEVAITGLARSVPTAKANTHIPDNEPSANIFYWRDQKAMAAHGGLDGATLLPFFIDAGEGATPGRWPKGGTTRISIPNRHLEYAVTWYGFAVTLIGVFAVFAWSRLKRVDEAA